jgi:hypothetical protein
MDRPKRRSQSRLQKLQTKAARPTPSKLSPTIQGLGGFDTGVSPEAIMGLGSNLKLPGAGILKDAYKFLFKSQSERKREIEALRRRNKELNRQKRAIEKELLREPMPKNPRYLQPLGDESGPNSPQAIQKQPAPGPRPPSSRKSSSRRVKLFNRPV